MNSGVINVYKEAGFTSFDVVAKLRGILKTKKIGHTGTLDPDAVGVLPVCIGNATKICDMLTDETKEYVAVMRLGITTDTLDMTGQILKDETHKLKDYSDKEVDEAIMSYEGNIEQVPPMYSALKVNGQKLCDLARKGIEVERKARHVRIYHIDIIDRFTSNDGLHKTVTMRVECSKGTYIRTLCNDIGDKLGCGACMEHLERTRVGAFRAENALTIDQIQKKRDEGSLHNIVIPVEDIFDKHEKLYVNQDGQKALLNGNKIRLNMVNQSDLIDGASYRLYSYDNQFCALYQYNKSDNVLTVLKMFLN